MAGIGNVGGMKTGMLVGAVILAVAFFVMIAFRFTAANLVPLYTGLSLSDSAKIVAELDKAGTPYELVSNGTQVMVPADRMLRLRMTMAEQGLPSGGSIVGYEIFDRTDTFGSSNFVMNINMMRALEGELSRTIASLAGVESARVHLVMPRQELFSRDKDKPSASVTVKMGGGHSLERAEVTAITHLVASAVPGLAASKVAVIDSHGRLLARGEGSEGADASASSSLEYRMAYENRMQQTLEDLLEKVVGPGRARVQLTADINFDRTVINSEKFDPEGQVARSTQSSSDRNNEQEKTGKDNVSAAGNTPQGASGAGESAGGSNKLAEQSNETTNYEISKVVQNQVKEGGSVNKISVAVLVDGNYTTGTDGAETYAPRSEDELKQIRTLVSSAIGYDEKRGDKIEVVNMRFTQPPAVEGESFFARFKVEMQSIFQTLIVAAVAILAILLVLKPAVTQLIRQTSAPSDRVAGDLAAIQAPAGAMAGGAPAPARLPSGGGGPSGEPELMIDVANIKGGMKSSSIKKITEIVDKYPEETMGVLRQWILKQS